MPLAGIREDRRLQESEVRELEEAMPSIALSTQSRHLHWSLDGNKWPCVG